MLADSEQEWADALDASRRDVAVLYEDNFNYLSKMCLLRMRQAAFPMLAHGASARLHRRSCAAATRPTTRQPTSTQGADYVLARRGRGDAGRAARPPRGSTPDARSRRSAAWRSATPTAQLVQHRRRPDMKDLDALPFPAWDLVDIDRYQAVWSAPRLLLDEHGHDARLPVPLQLVRQADLGPALQRRAAPRTSPPSSPG